MEVHVGSLRMGLRTLKLLGLTITDSKLNTIAGPILDDMGENLVGIDCMKSYP